MNKIYPFVVITLCFMLHLSAMQQAIQQLCGEVWIHENPSHTIALLLAVVPKTHNHLYGFTRRTSKPATDERLIGYLKDDRGEIYIYGRSVDTLDKPQGTPSYWVSARSFFNAWRGAHAMNTFIGFSIPTIEREKPIVIYNKFLQAVGKRPLMDDHGEPELSVGPQPEILALLNRWARQGYDEQGRNTHTDEGVIIRY